MSILLGDTCMSLMEANQRHGYEDTEAFYRKVVKRRQTLDVLPFYPSNQGNVHVYTQAVKLGKGTWRNANEGYTRSTAKMESITQNLKLYSTYSFVSNDNLALEGAAARESEDDMIGRGVLESFLDDVINADGKNPKSIKGFAGYRNKVDDTLCLDAGGTTNANLTSLYLAEFGPETLNVRYNPAITGDQYGIGLKTLDKGEQQHQDSEGKVMFGYMTTFDMTAGIELRQQESLIRIANIDTKEGAFPEDLIVDAITTLPSSGSGAVMLAPRPIYAMYMKYALNKSNMAFTVETIENLGLVLRFLGIPILREDAIRIGEKVA